MTQPPKRKNKPGAGRRPGTGTYGEVTTALRVPISQERVVRDFLEAYRRDNRAPELRTQHEVRSSLHIATTPPENQGAKPIALYKYLKKGSENSVINTIHDYSMVDKGLLPDDKVVVDRSREAKSGDIVLASVDGVFIVRVLRAENGVTKLVAANSVDNYPEIEKFEVRGVVTGSFRRFK